MANQRSGLRTTVSLYGTVVEQKVSWCPRFFGRGRWTSVGEMMPGAGPQGVARFRWGPGGELDLEAHSEPLRSGADGSWAWSNGRGVSLRIDVIPMKRAQRRSQDQVGDLALLVMMLTLMVGLAQLNFLFRAIVGERVASTEAMTPSPELIARLLQKEFQGVDEGPVAHVQRPGHVRPSKSFYLPAGSRGPMDRPGGGETADDHARRAAPAAEEGQAITDGDPVTTSSKEPLLALAPAGEPLELEPPLDGGAVGGDRGLPPSVERFIGWGFHDWMDAANPEAVEIVEQLSLARELMKLDPDVPYASLTVAFFAYLSYNYSV